MSRREREEEEIGLTHKVSFQGIGQQVTQGAMTMTITDAWVEHNGGRVSEIPEGGKFDIYASYDCFWSEASFFNPWAVAVTVSGDGIANVDRTRINADRGSGTMKLDSNGPNIMPGKDISLTFKPWGHPDGATFTLPASR